MYSSYIIRLGHRGLLERATAPEGNGQHKNVLTLKRSAIDHPELYQ
jgi:hypothetical protein